ncbi:MAG: hypothetical protein ACP5HG_15025 [Anaerolineae bacterium]
MFVTALLAAMVAAGATLTVRGILALRGRYRPRVSLVERPLIDVIAPKDEALPLVLGRLRIAFGVFLMVAGIWGLLA